LWKPKGFHKKSGSAFPIKYFLEMEAKIFYILQYSLVLVFILLFFNFCVLEAF